MRLGFSLLGGLALACAAPAAAQPSPEDEQKCWDTGEAFAPEEQVAACTALLAAGGLLEEDRPYVVAMRGWSYHKLGDLEHALADYSEKVRLQPEAADGYGWRGSVYLDQEDYARALDDYSQAIRLAAGDVDLPAWFQDRATARHLLGDHQGAITDYTAALEAGGENAGVFLLRGYVHFDLKDYASAVADYTQAINLAPDEASNWNDRCWARGVWGRQLVEALDDCNEALALDPESFDAWDSRGLVHLRREAWEEALLDYQGSLDIEPSASAHFGRGVALKRLGNDSEAEEAFAAAAELDPAIAETYAGFGITP
jgi:tetratricopeptide (TPR) repeat protein